MHDDDDSELAAGAFAPWLAQMVAALDERSESDVPCAGCTACCRSAQFIHVAPDERATLARIPLALQFPAPRMPAGHVVIPHDERGHCPMLVDDRCSIYEDRPRACRTYDCRIYAATGVDIGVERPLVAARVRRWRFAVDTDADRATQVAVHRAADAVARADDARNATEHAVRAVERHREFLDVT